MIRSVYQIGRKFLHGINLLMTVVLVPSLRHQLLLLISILPLLPKTKKVQETILWEKFCKSKTKEEILSRRTLEASLEAQLWRNRVAHLIQKKKINQEWLKKTKCVFFFHFRLASLHRVALQRQCQSSLKRRKIHWEKCNLEFRKCRIKDCKWSKVPEKCGIKECEWWLWFQKPGIKDCKFWTKFAFFNSAFFCSAGFFFALLSSFKKYFIKFC